MADIATRLKTFIAGLRVTGSTDIVQALFKGNATQTNNIVEVRDSTNSLLFAIAQALATFGGEVVANGSLLSRFWRGVSVQPSGASSFDFSSISAGQVYIVAGLLINGGASANTLQTGVWIVGKSNAGNFYQRAILASDSPGNNDGSMTWSSSTLTISRGGVPNSGIYAMRIA